MGRHYITDDEARQRFHDSYRIDESGCWVWQKYLSLGYGRMEYNHQRLMAHRFAYELLVGPIPSGKQIDHLCRNRACVNPAHLEPVDIRTNLLRGNTHASRNAAKTQCKHGHPLTPENVYVIDGRRRCRTCSHDAYVRQRDKNPERYLERARQNARRYQAKKRHSLHPVGTAPIFVM